MKNKNILYGLLGVGAIAGLYFWNKNKKSDTNIITDTPKTNLISDGAKKIVSYLNEKYQDGKNPKYQHHDMKEFFEPKLNYGNMYVSLEQLVKKYSKSDNDTNSIINIYLLVMSQQTDSNDIKLTDESSLFLAKNPSITNEIKGFKTKMVNGTIFNEPVKSFGQIMCIKAPC
jgi:hypothetical protein